MDWSAFLVSVVEGWLFDRELPEPAVGRLRQVATYGPARYAPWERTRIA